MFVGVATDRRNAARCKTTQQLVATWRTPAPTKSRLQQRPLDYCRNDKSAYRDRKARAKVHLNASFPAIYDIFTAQESPTRSTAATWSKLQRENANLYSVLFAAANGGISIVVRRREEKQSEHGLEGEHAA